MHYCCRLRHCHLFIFAALSGVLFWGCSTTGKNTSLLDPPPLQYDDSPVSDESAWVPQADDTLSATVPSIVEVQITRAKELCASMEYAAADSVVREALSIITSEQQRNDTGLNDDPFIQEIIGLYTGLLPDSFPAPEEISLQVFQYRMLRSFDSLEISAEDSAVVSRLFNNSKIQYNVPVVWNSRVQRALFYYVIRNRRTIDVWRDRSAVYLPFMKKMFADSGLPEDLAYLPLIESGFNPKAYSRSHASGIWQFIPSTGVRYGLRNNYWIDERRDPVGATVGAIKYLKKLYNDFGHWHLALAAYNCGEGGLSRAIAKRGVNDYWQLKLPAETMNYVPLYLASLIIARNPEFHSAGSILSDTVPFDTVTVDDCIDIREIADGIDISVDSLKRLNPHILRWCTPPDMTGIRLYLPAGSAPAFASFYAALPDEKKVRWYRYRIRRGDNLGSIARQFKIPVEGLRSVNSLRGTRIVAGHDIFIPIPVGAAAYAEAPPEKKQSALPPIAAEVPDNAELTVYEVKPGDSVWRLAEIFGVDPDQICGWNNLADNQIRAGQVLSIYTVAPGTPVQHNIKKTSPVMASWHIVHAGETMYGIAREFGMTVEELSALNGYGAVVPRIAAGDSMRVRAVDTPRQSRRSHVSADAIFYIVAQGDNLFRIAQNFSTTTARICELNRLSGSSKIRSGDTLLVPKPLPPEHKNQESLMKEIVYYQVKSGDNLWRIANNFGIPVERLCRDNNIATSSVLLPGDTLRVLREGEM